MILNRFNGLVPKCAYIPLLAALHWRLQVPREMLVKHAMAAVGHGVNAATTATLSQTALPARGAVLNVMEILFGQFCIFQRSSASLTGQLPLRPVSCCPQAESTISFSGPRVTRRAQAVNSSVRRPLVDAIAFWWA